MCVEEFGSERGLDGHKRLVHGGKDKEIKEVLKEKFACGKCERVFENKNAVR